MKFVKHNNFTYVEDSTLEELTLLRRILSISSTEYSFTGAQSVCEEFLWEDNSRFKFLTGLFDFVAQNLNRPDLIIEDNTNFKSYNLEFSNGLLNDIILRDDQVFSIKKCLKLTRGIVDLPTRTGKTEVFCGVSKLYQDQISGDKKIIIIEDQVSLMRQTAERLKLRGVQNVGMLGDGEDDFDSQIIVCVIDTFYSSWKKGNCEEFFSNIGGIIYDECFPAGTLVDGKPIESLKVGDLVNSFNHNENKIELKEIKRLFKSELKKDLYKIKFSNGSSFICTSEHPIYDFDLKKYVPANLLKINAQVIYGNRNFRKTLLNLWETNHPRNKKIRKLLQNWKSILFRRMFETVFKKDFFRNNEKNEFEVCFRENEEKQSNEKRRIKKKSKFKINRNWPSTNLYWRKWKTSSRTTKTISRIVEVANRVFNKNWGFKKGTSRDSVFLQGGHSFSRSKLVHRNRWSKSCLRGVQKFRQKERDGIGKTWVESIEIFKRGSSEQFGELCQDNIVYNIEVEGNNNYFAEGVLVHNCHHASSPTSKELISSFENLDLLLGFSGTPFENRKNNFTTPRDMTLIGLFHRTIVRISPKFFIDAGIISEPNVFFVTYDFNKLPFFIQSYNKVYERFIVSNKTRNELASHIARHCYSKNLSFLMSIVQILHGKRILGLLSGITDAVFSYGDNTNISLYSQKSEDVFINKIKKIEFDKDLNQKVIYFNKSFDVVKEVNDKNVSIVIGSSVFDEGRDIPNLDGIILLGGGSSFTKSIQRPARSLTRSYTRSRSFIIDFLDNVHPYLKSHSKSRRELYFENYYNVSDGTSEFIQFLNSLGY